MHATYFIHQGECSWVADAHIHMVEPLIYLNQQRFVNHTLHNYVAGLGLTPLKCKCVPNEVLTQYISPCVVITLYLFFAMTGIQQRGGTGKKMRFPEVS